MSSRRRLKLIGVAGLITILLSGLTMGAFAENPEAGDPEDPIVQGEEEALQHDAEVYAEHFDVDVDIAKRNLQLQESAGELQAELYENEVQTYAGQWIEHVPEFRVIVQFTDGDVQRAMAHMPNALAESQVEVREAEYSLTELDRQQNSASDIIGELGIDSNITRNVRENRVEIWVLDGDELEAALNNKQQALPEAVTIIEVDELIVSETKTPATSHSYPSSEDSPASGHGGDIYAGLDLLPVCTTGFAVQHDTTNVSGVLTAGHCDAGPYPFWSYNGEEVPMEDAWAHGSYDFQWHSTPNHTLQNRAMVSQHPYQSRLITGQVDYWQQSVGEWVCFFGASTGHQTCGQIDEKGFNPDPGGIFDAATYILVAGSNLADHGDSGGPVYIDNNAYGVLHGIRHDGDQAVYMAIDFIEDFNLSVLN